MIKNSKNILNEKILLYFGISTFIYALCIGLIIQFFILGTLFNISGGLVVLDSVGFDTTAKEMSLAIKERGWQVWELRPKNSAPAGIASIFYTLWTPQPYTLLPFNALVHALSGCVVVWILSNFFSWKPAIIGGAIFVLNPAAMEWVAQIHRDGLFIFGNLLVLVCIFKFFDGFRSNKGKTMAWGLFWGVIGTLLVWVARPYWVEALMVSILLWLILFFFTYKFLNFE